MISRDSIKKLNSVLERGDKREIARQSNLSIVTVSRFLNGNEVSSDSAAKIVEKATRIINQRKKIQEKSEQGIKSATKKL